MRVCFDCSYDLNTCQFRAKGHPSSAGKQVDAYVSALWTFHGRPAVGSDIFNLVPSERIQQHTSSRSE
jgi:hypothetical protein